MPLPTIPQEIIDAALKYPGEVEVHGAFLAVADGIDGHTDPCFPEWSAFLTVRNDDCRVWQQGGYKGRPKPGERFLVNIHKRHGVSTRKAGTIIVLLHADGDTPEEAQAKLAVAEAETSK